MTPPKSPRGFIVAAAASHSGKTTIALGLIAALRQRGLSVAAAKCGPDYIDPKFLEAASGKPVINLDPWAMRPDVIHTRLAQRAAGVDIVVVEGVMGLYDGGPRGAGSTASLAKMTGLPVVLVVGTQGTAQSAAAVAEGCARLAEGFHVAGAIANQVASERHADLIREGFSRTSVPLLGLVKREPAVTLPSRHLGLVQAEEHADLAAKIAKAGELVEQGCDVERIAEIATRSPPPCGEGMEEDLSAPRQGIGAPPLALSGKGEGDFSRPWASASRSRATSRLPSPIRIFSTTGAMAALRSPSSRRLPTKGRRRTPTQSSSPAAIRSFTPERLRRRGNFASPWKPPRRAAR